MLPADVVFFSRESFSLARAELGMLAAVAVLALAVSTAASPTGYWFSFGDSYVVRPRSGCDAHALQVHADAVQLHVDAAERRQSARYTAISVVRPLPH